MFFFIYSSGQGKVPQNFMREKYFFEDAFPEVLVNGQFGLHADRSIKVSPAKWISHRVMHHSETAAKKTDFIFVGAQYIERHNVERNIDVETKKGLLKTKSDGTKTIVSPSNVLNVFKPITGSSQYWRAFRYDMIARMHQCGPFHIFFTVSCAELRWPEILASVLKSKGHTVTFDPPVWTGKAENIFIDGVPLPQFSTAHVSNKTKEFEDSYVRIIRMFDNRVKSFVNNILMYTEVEFYTYRVEFQARGMPHIHGVLWLKNDAVMKYIDKDREFDAQLAPEFIDKWCSVDTKTEDEELNRQVREVNCHKHTSSCLKFNQTCRFKFPRYPSDCTILADQLPDDLKDRQQVLDDAKKTLEKVKKALVALKDKEVNISLKDFLSALQVDYDEYHKALSITNNGKKVVLKRSVNDRNINNYNAFFMKAWNANMDIQVAIDHYSVISYITDYMSKAENDITPQLREALETVKDCNSFKQLNHLKQVFIKHSEMGLAQAIYKIIPGLHLKSSNVKTIFVSSGFPDHRSALWKRVYENPSNDIGKENSQIDREEQKNLVTIEGKEGQFQKTKTFQDNYSRRPGGIEKICLSQFSTSFDACQKPKDVYFVENMSEEKGDLELFGTNEQLPKYIILNDDALMKCRSTPSIMRMHDSSKKSNYEFHYSELLLFHHWRNEVVDLHLRNPQKCMELYKEQLNKTIMPNKKSMFPFSKQVEAIECYIEAKENTRPEHLYDSIDAINQAENLENQSEMPPKDTTELPEESETEVTKNKTSCDVKFKEVFVDEDWKRRQLVRQMSTEQRIAFDLAIKYCKEVVMARKKRTFHPVPPRLIIHGGGGCGKSFLINVISQFVQHILQQPGDNIYHPKVLLMAPTGRAASLIGKTHDSN